MQVPAPLAASTLKAEKADKLTAQPLDIRKTSGKRISRARARVGGATSTGGREEKKSRKRRPRSPRTYARNQFPPGSADARRNFSTFPGPAKNSASPLPRPFRDSAPGGRGWGRRRDPINSLIKFTRLPREPIISAPAQN